MSLTRFYGSAFFGIIFTVIFGVIRWRVNPTSGPLLHVSRIGLWPMELLHMVALKSSGTTLGDVRLYAVFENAAAMLDVVGFILAAAFYSVVAYMLFPRKRRERW